ncbi:hypothetical protein SKTS_09500 [Sulfurimicrobium lacus]|uniref:Alginate export domain-containing protein n=1 Tax=Sulfurimicrobium lacus TaxID=2715678 RepID=A0A6F8V8S7_9PROT|nr:hypothetical protein [Sulfurimicrobium lacus]BCB26064.1 hypothetical protein SKTS_09500 [Sulfurimicrobium lacus]
MRLVVLALSAFVATASAAESDWRTSWDGTLYGYANSTSLRDDSVLNPGNRVAGLAQHSEVAELRLNLKAENESVRLTARPIISTREQRNAYGTQQRNEAYLSRWQVQVRTGEGWNVAAGRDVLNWGPAQFRSPSSPFYFDNGRSDPMRELVGMDTLKLSLTPDMQSSVSLARIVRSGHGAAQPDVWRDSWLAKLDRRGDEWAYGLVAVKAPNLPAFYGAHGQITVSDALMLYGELGSSAQAVALQSSADAAQPFVAQAPGPRRSTALVGASHAFEDGTSLAAEYLHEGHGYTAAQESAYFQRAVAAPDIALGLAPRLLGRDYLHLVWQSNLMDERGYWRLMFTRNLSDGGNEIAAYGETVLGSEISAFALAVLPQGDARQEFSALLQRSVTLGLKIALP